MWTEDDVDGGCRGGYRPPGPPRIESLRSRNGVASLHELSRFAPPVESLRSIFRNLYGKSILFLTKIGNMERSDSINGAKRLHFWSEATLVGWVRRGGSPPGLPPFPHSLTWNFSFSFFESFLGPSGPNSILP